MKIMLANFSKMVNASGGLAKVTCAFANEMLNRTHSISLVYIDERDGIFFYPINPAVKLYNLCRMNSRVIKFPLTYKIERELFRPVDVRRAREVNDKFMKNYLLDNVQQTLQLEQPDVIISSQPAASRIFLCELDSKIPVITMSHGDPEDYFHKYPVDELPALEKSSACQVLLPSFVESLKKRYPNLLVETIGNVVPQLKKTDLTRKKDVHKIIFVGRLVRNHKRPHLLIEAFDKIKSQINDKWIVEFWGDSDNHRYTKKLEKMIRENNLTGQVFLKGTTRNVEKILNSGDIFVTTSAYEGFSLALGEAMSAGLPSIGFKSCVAVNELIHNAENGFLCDDVDELANKMLTLIQDQNLRVKLGNNAHEFVKKFRASIIWDQWENLIKRVCEK